MINLKELLLSLNFNNWVIESINKGRHIRIMIINNLPLFNRIDILNIKEITKPNTINKYNPKHLAHKGNSLFLNLKHLSGF